MKTEFLKTYRTDLSPLNFFILPCIYIYSDCKAYKRKFRTINFSWLWYTFIIEVDT